MSEEKDKLEGIPVLGMLEDVWDIAKPIFTEGSVKDAIKENAPDLVAGTVDTVMMNPMGKQDSGNSVGGSLGRVVGAGIKGGWSDVKQVAAAEAVGFVPNAIEGLGVVAGAYTGIPELADVGKVAGGAAKSLIGEVWNNDETVGDNQMRVVGTSMSLEGIKSTPRPKDYLQAEREASAAGGDYYADRQRSYESVRNVLGLANNGQVNTLIDALHFLLEDRFNKDL